MLASRDNLPLLAELLAEQQLLDTPAARFSAAHDAGSINQFSALASQLIPISAPKPGEQYAFEVDLDSCTGCKSCVAACHSLNGLDDNETWRDVGLLVSPSRARPFTQTLTTACHHCADPGCLNGCPVLAYEKDPITGIVRHLDDQCIGCSYCILMCPYDVPKFSERLGIVRKCDMCHSRLAAGEAPACAQACPTHAIRIVTVSLETGVRRAETGKGRKGRRKAEVENASKGERRKSESETLSSDSQGLSGFRSPVSGFPKSPVPSLPFPSHTHPTTRYVSRRKVPDNLVAADAGSLCPQPPHWPLVLMLTLMPAAVGLSCAATVWPASGIEEAVHPVALAAWLAGAVGLVASVFHLGQPLRAWRIFLGWRRSWLSREAMVFGLWLGLASAAVLERTFLIPSAIVGLAGLACSVMIYVDTHRHFWRAAQTAPRFFGVAALFALAPFAPWIAAGLLTVKLAWEWRTVFDQSTSARLQRGPLSRAALVRDGFALVSIVLLAIAPGWIALLMLFAGELAERYLFFRAVDAPNPPGVAA